MGKTGLGAIVCKTAHVRFRSRKRVHTRLSEKDRTQRLTRRNTGVSDGGGITTLGALRVLPKRWTVGCQNGKLCRFCALIRCASEERGEPAGQRCVHARRCPEASQPRWAALLCLQLGDVAVLSLCAQYFLNVQGWGGITTLGALCMFSKCRTAACQSG